MDNKRVIIPYDNLDTIKTGWLHTSLGDEARGNKTVSELFSLSETDNVLDQIGNDHRRKNKGHVILQQHNVELTTKAAY